MPLLSTIYVIIIFFFPPSLTSLLLSRYLDITVYVTSAVTIVLISSKSCVHTQLFPSRRKKNKKNMPGRSNAFAANPQ